jgi:prevent-host-death family protein
VITRVRETHRPVLITQNGRAGSYLVDAESLDELVDRIELSRDIEISRREAVLVRRLLAEALAGGPQRRTFMRGKIPRKSESR